MANPVEVQAVTEHVMITQSPAVTALAVVEHVLLSQSTSVNAQAIAEHVFFITPTNTVDKQVKLEFVGNGYIPANDYATALEFIAGIPYGGNDKQVKLEFIAQSTLTPQPPGQTETWFTPPN